MKKRLFAAALCLALCVCPLTVMAGEELPASEGPAAKSALTSESLPAPAVDSALHTCDGVTVSGLPADVRLIVEPWGDEAGLLALLRERYPGSSPRIISARTIRYEYAATGEAYDPRKGGALLSLDFSAPAGYEGAAAPLILRCDDGELGELSPDLLDGVLHIRSARTLTNLIVADLPVALTGISLPEGTSVNAGRRVTLRASAVPETATEEYALAWTSSDKSVAAVDDTGVVTGVAAGSCTITASVRGRSGMKASCEVTVVTGTHALTRSVAEVLAETRDYMLKTDTSPTVGSEWFALGLARSGLDLDDPYFKTYYNHFANYLAENQGVLTNTVKLTEYSRTIVALTAIGADARDVGGYDLFEPLADFEKVCAQGINGPIWALIAMNCHPDYAIPEAAGVAEQTTEARLIDYILGRETPLAGWSLTGKSPDPDITGMALQALAPYYGRSGYEEVTSAADRALEALSGMQDSEGGYSSWGAKASESSVQVLTALCALGIDPAADERFVKGGAWIVENLLSFHVDGSGFMHVKPGSDGNGGAEAGEVDGMATEQGFYGLTAYQRFLDGRTALYDMSDVAISPGGKGDGSGTGLEPPETPKPTVTPKPTAAAKPGGSTGKQLGTSGSSGGQNGTSRVSSGTPRSASPTSNTVRSSGNSQSDGDDTGWDFEAEDYAFDSGSGEDSGWDVGAIEELPEQAAPTAETAAQEGNSRGGLAMMLLWAFGALCGVAGMAARKPLVQIRKQMGLHGEAPGTNGRRDPRVALIGWLSGLQDLLERSVRK